METQPSAVNLARGDGRPFASGGSGAARDWRASAAMSGRAGPGRSAGVSRGMGRARRCWMGRMHSSLRNLAQRRALASGTPAGISKRFGAFQVRGRSPRRRGSWVSTSSRKPQFLLAVLAVFSLVSWYLTVLSGAIRRIGQLGDRFLAEVGRPPRLEEAITPDALPPSHITGCCRSRPFLLRAKTGS